MRVLWVNEAADFIGGCEQHIFDTVSLLRERGVQCSLLYDCRRNLSPDFVKPFERTFPIVDVPAQVAELQPDLIYAHRLSGRTIVEELRNTGVPVARFLHDYQLFCPREHRYSAIGLQTCRKPIGLRCYACLGMINRADNRLGFRLTFVHTLRSAIRANRKLDAFVVGSDYMAKLIAAHGFAPERTHVIQPYALPPRTVSSCTRERDLFLFAGQLLRSKGVDTLLEALALTRHPCRLVITGRGRQEGLFRAMAERLKLNDRVSFLGRVPYEELAKRYSQALCAIMPSRFPETFGLIGPEAMSYGTAVIGTTVGAIGEWLEDGVTGIAVPPNDAASLARAMDRIIENPEMAIQMGRTGKQRYEENFRPERHVDSLLRLFETLASRGNVRGS